MPLQLPLGDNHFLLLPPPCPHSGISFKRCAPFMRIFRGSRENGVKPFCTVSINLARIHRERSDGWSVSLSWEGMAAWMGARARRFLTAHARACHMCCPIRGQHGALFPTAARDSEESLNAWCLQADPGVEQVAAVGPRSPDHDPSAGGPSKNDGEPPARFDTTFTPG